MALRARPFSNQALDTVQDTIRPIAHRAAVSGDALVGGQTSASVDVREAINRDSRVIYPVAALMIALIVGLLLRSVAAALYLLMAVVLGNLATPGTTVSVFQGVGGQPGLGVALPLIVYLLIVAIATGYNILVTARLREELRAGAAPRRATGRAVEHTAPTIAAAAVILAATFASLALTGIGSLVEMGFAVAIGAVLAVSAMAVLFVPSVAALIGRRIWWPGRTQTSSRASNEATGVVGDSPISASTGSSVRPVTSWQPTTSAIDRLSIAPELVDKCDGGDHHAEDRRADSQPGQQRVDRFRQLT